MSLTEVIENFHVNITPFQASIALSVILLYVLWLNLKDTYLPPGPRGIPLFGYWPFLRADTCHKQLHELSKVYGDVFSLRITGRLFIYLGSLKAMKEAHMTKSECFGQRFSDESILHFIFGEGVICMNGEQWRVLRKFFLSKLKEYGLNAVKENAASSVYDTLKEIVEELRGVIFMNGEQWRVLRKFFLSKLKEYGLNAVKENAASSVYDTLKETVEELRGARGRPVQIADMVTIKCMTIIRRILFNDEVITMEEFQEVNDLYAEVMKGMTGTNMLLTGKFSKYFIQPFVPSIRKLKKCHRRIEAIFFDVVERRKKEYRDSQITDDIIDCYFKAREERRKKGDPTAACLTDEALVATLGQFVADGALSIGAFILCVLMKLVEYPDEQEKVYREILEVVGQDRLPTLEDKSRLPYTNAFIYEVIRSSEFFPMFPSLECTRETTLRGYRIPKGSITILNMYAANQNPEDFENPDEFKPSRYIATAEKPKAEHPMLFGLGKRACIGEAFSMIQTFLFLTTIVQNFRLSLPEGSQGSSMFWAQEKAKICVYARTQKN